MEEKKTTIKEVKIENGLELKIDIDTVDDMEFLELSDRVQKDITAYPALVKKLLGEENYQKVSDFYKKKNGKFRTSEAQNIFEKILELVNPKD